MKIESLDTIYNGYNFRSRLEARWAVYFEEMGWRYLYEPQGYVLSDGTKYLPDFYLPDFKTFVEVKFDVLDVFDYERAELLVKDSGISLIILDSDPSIKSFTQITLENDEIVLNQVNLVEDLKTKKLITNHLLSTPEDYDLIGDTRPIEAIKKAKLHRFGIFE